MLTVIALHRHQPSCNYILVGAHNRSTLIEAMSSDLREHSRATSTGIKACAAAGETIAFHLRVLKENLPRALELPPNERHQMVDELRDALITWGNQLDPLRRDLCSVLRELVAAPQE